jgi:hypothetical protein
MCVCGCVYDALLGLFFLFLCSFAFISKHVFLACYYTKNFTVLKRKKKVFAFRKFNLIDRHISEKGGNDYQSVHLTLRCSFI